MTTSTKATTATGGGWDDGYVGELRFLEDMVQLAAGAATWDELMQLIVDRSTAALRTQVCSLYLVDRDDAGLTLAATNGVDRQHVGVARLAIGEGITGLAASERQPIATIDLRNDPRCAWIRGVDHARYTSMIAVPLIVRDRLVGVLNVKTVERRQFKRGEIRQLATIAALLGGIVERRRLQMEAEAQLDALRSIDQARAELIAVVTHQLRTPLAVVRAYLDLLAEAATRGKPDKADGANADDGPDADDVDAWRAAAVGQVERLDGLVSAVLEMVRADRLLTVNPQTFEVGAVIDEVLTRLAPLLREHTLERYPTGDRLAFGDPMRLAQVLELLLENAAKYAPQGATVVVADWTDGDEIHVAVGDNGPGVPLAERERVFEPFVRGDATHDGDRPGSGVGLFAARRLMAGMGGRLWIEDKVAGGTQFVAAIPAAPAKATAPATTAPATTAPPVTAKATAG